MAKEVRLLISGEMEGRLEELVKFTRASDIAAAVADAIFVYSELRRVLENEAPGTVFALANEQTGTLHRVILPTLFKERLRLVKD